MSAPVLRVVGIRGAVVGQAVVIGAGPVVLGRDPGCTLSVADQTLSRRHVQFWSSEQGAWIEDLGSANGVLLNGGRLTAPVILQPGDEIAVGAQTFRFEVTAPGVIVERSSLERVASSSTDLQKAPGCLPNLNGISADFSGILPGTYRFLPWILGLVVAFLVLSLAANLIRAIVDAATGSKPTPAASAPPASESTSGAGIEILEKKVEITAQGPVIKVKWKNGTSNPVKHIKGDITIREASGESLLELKDADVYIGPPVSPGETHEPERRDGIGLPMGTTNGKIEIKPTGTS